MKKIPEVIHELANRWQTTKVWHSMKKDDSAWHGEIHVTVKDCKDCFDYLIRKCCHMHLRWYLR